jgi:hypothetical protein
MSFTKTFTITFGDVAENHKGMQKIGDLAKEGFNLEDLHIAKSWFEERKCNCTIISLHELLPKEQQNSCNNAWVLIVKSAVNALLEDSNGVESLFFEQDTLEKDTKAFMYGRVVNKHARHNLCFGEKSQQPNYEEGKGRVYAFNELNNLNKIRTKLGEIIGEKALNLQAEGNYYFDITKCGIGYHGDAERKKVIAIRLGAIMPLHFRWYHDNKIISDTIKITNLEHGDLYIMSEKSTGYDWKSKSKYTLRHSAGCKKYTEPVSKT